MKKATGNYKSNYVKKDYKKKFKELNLLQAEAAHQKSKYENLNKAFTKKKTYKQETVNIVDSYDTNINSSSISESTNYSTRTDKRKTLITYDSDSADNGKNSSNSNRSEDSH